MPAAALTRTIKAKAEMLDPSRYGRSDRSPLGRQAAALRPNTCAHPFQPRREADENWLWLPQPYQCELPIRETQSDLARCSAAHTSTGHL